MGERYTITLLPVADQGDGGGGLCPPPLFPIKHVFKDARHTWSNVFLENSSPTSTKFLNMLLVAVLLTRKLKINGVVYLH